MKTLFRTFLQDFRGLNRRVAGVLIYACLALTCNYYLSNPRFVHSCALQYGWQHIADTIETRFIHPADTNLASLMYWIGVLSVFYLIVPMLIVRLVFRQPLSEFGWRPFIGKEGWKIYAVGLFIMLPLVFLASHTAGFLQKYPFLKLYTNAPFIGRPLLYWECLYFFQFLALEFFFRGFLVHSLKPALGLYSILIMTIPYCMIHFGKPMAESLAAIAAGLVLGWLSYRHNSIWLGVLLHCSVALSMDLLAIWQKA